MAKRVSARDARARFAELTDRVCYTGEPVIVEKQGRPFVAVVSLQDFDELEHHRRERAGAAFLQEASKAAREPGAAPTEEEIVEAVKRTRETLHRERYGAA